MDPRFFGIFYRDAIKGAVVYIVWDCKKNME